MRDLFGDEAAAEGLLGSIQSRDKVGDIRNQHPYVINYVSAKSGKIFDSREIFFFGGRSSTIFSTKSKLILL
jgi:hypothetical protein